MAENSSIEWTDTTWNPVTGCTKAPDVTTATLKDFQSVFAECPDIRLKPDLI
jgi:protein gp37